ncbi:MAG: Rieske 2Fe-2S domain-containing protein [Proteobacteria bacterium]|nr:Rieske 2Fe-2S domain-containing protein [Pseudomonadota bacterium]
MAPPKPDRRKFLKLATSAVGGGLGLIVVAPALRLLGEAAGSTTVKTPIDPIDVGAVERFPVDTPIKVTIVAAEVTDAWTSARDVVLGAAWVRRTGDKSFEVFSAVCPHLGCGVDFDGKQFACPCHDSKFALAGAAQPGAVAKRGLDSLEHDVTADGRLRITWARFALDTEEKRPA